MRGVRDKVTSSPPPWAPGPGSAALLVSLSAWSIAIGVATMGDSVTTQNGATVVLAVSLVIVLALTTVAIGRTLSSLATGVGIALLLAGCVLVVPFLYLSPINVGRAAVRVGVSRVAGFVIWGLSAATVPLLFLSESATS